MKLQRSYSAAQAKGNYVMKVLLHGMLELWGMFD